MPKKLSDADFIDSIEQRVTAAAAGAAGEGTSPVPLRRRRRLPPFFTRAEVRRMMELAGEPRSFMNMVAFDRSDIPRFALSADMLELCTPARVRHSDAGGGEKTP